MSIRTEIKWLLLYAAVAVVILWPGVGSGVDSVPGGMRTDLWNGLWSLDFQRDALLSGTAPWSVDVLGHPLGGKLPPVDPLGMLFFVPAGLLGTSLAYQSLIVFRLALGGWLVQQFAQEFCEAHGQSDERSFKAAVFAGVATASAPVLVAGVHNGTSEAANACGLIFSVWMGWRYGRDPNSANGWRLAIGLLWASLTSWYVAVLAFVHAGFVVLLHARQRGFFQRCAPILTGLALVLPWAILVVVLLQVGESNLSAHAFSMETGGAPNDNFGAADWGAWLSVSETRDIAILSESERGMGFFHCTALAWVLLGLAAIGLGRMFRQELALVGLLLVAFVFSFGTHMSIFGWEVPMPYGVLLDLPGFSQLSLPFRYGIGVLPVLAVAAALALTRFGLRGVVLASTILLVQLRLFSSISGGVPAIDLKSLHGSQLLVKLEQAPDGGVLHFPIWSHHRSLYSQRMHNKALTIAFDRASPEIDIQFWEAVREARQQGDWSKVSDVAQGLGLRYVLIDSKEQRLRSDPHYELVQALMERFEVMSEPEDKEDLQGVVLW